MISLSSNEENILSIYIKPFSHVIFSTKIGYGTHDITFICNDKQTRHNRFQQNMDNKEN